MAACMSVHICSIYWRKGYAVHVCVCPICNIWVCWLGFIELQSSSTHHEKIRRHRPSYLTSSWTFLLGACAKLRKATISFVMSVRPSAWTTRLPLDGSSQNLIHEYFSKICWANSYFIKIEREYRLHYMKTDINIWSYLAQLSSEWEMFQTTDVEKIKTHIFIQ